MQTILLVEHDFQEREYLSERLESYLSNYRIITKSSCHQARSFIEQQSIDMLVLEVVSPILDGYELVMSVKEHFPASPIFIVSRLSLHAIEQILEKEMITCFFQKPVNFLFFADMIRETIEL